MCVHAGWHEGMLFNHPVALILMRSALVQAVVTFDLNADLRSIFSWNTKQLFVYVQAEYETEDNKRNEIVLWDSIIQQKVRGRSLGQQLGQAWRRFACEVCMVCIMCNVWLGLQDKALIKLKGHKTKYAFIDQGKNLRGRDVNLTLVWSVMPKVGKRA